MKLPRDDVRKGGNNQDEDETMSNEATKETTPFVHFKAMVIDAAGLSVADVNKFSARVGIAFDMGEPVWMIADEIKLRAAAPAKHKTPKQLAASFGKVARKDGQNDNAFYP